MKTVAIAVVYQKGCVMSKPKIFKFSNGYVVECEDAAIELDNDGNVVGGGVLEEPRQGQGISIDDIPKTVAGEILKITGWRIPRAARKA